MSRIPAGKRATKLSQNAHPRCTLARGKWVRARSLKRSVGSAPEELMRMANDREVQAFVIGVLTRP